MSAIAQETSNGSQATTTTTMSVYVAPVNDAPLVSAVAETATGNEDTAITGTLLAGSDVDSSNLTFQIVANSATNGTVTITNAATGAYSFTPSANYNGPASFQYVINDGSANSTAKTVNLTVNPVNDNPVVSAVAESATGNEDTAITGTLLAGSDVDSSNLTFQIVAGTATNGTVTITNATTGTYSFTPTANYNGPASFQYRISDGTATSTTKTVNLTVNPVNDAPVATGETLASVKEDSGVRVISFASLLANDSTGPANESGQTLTITGLSNIVGGTAVINGTNVEFTPTANFNGTASFSYTIQDNGQSAGVNDFKTATATASFSVTAVPDAPVGTATTITATEDTPRAFTAADFGFTDPNDTPANTFSGVVITTLPSAGTLTNNGVAVTAGNAITIADINAGRLVYTPAANGNGSAYSSFTFQVQDNATLTGTSVNTNGLITGWTGTNTVTLIQGPTSAADQTVFAGAQNVGAPNAVIKTDIANQPLAIATTGSQYHLAFDFLNLVGYGAAPLTVQVFAGTTLIGSKSQAKLTTFPSLISLSLDTSAVSAADNGKPINIVWSAGGGHGDLIAIDNVALTQIGGNGSNLLVNGDFGSGSYYVGANTDTTPRTMTIDVTPVNDAPVAVADVYSGPAVVEIGAGIAGQPTATGNVLNNDTDVDSGDTKTVTTPGTLNGTYGSLVLNADGSYIYTLDDTKAATQALKQGQQVNEVFNYTMKDTAGATSSSSLTVAITGTNDAPVGANITYTLSEDALRSAYLNLSATDPDSTNFTFSNVRLISGPDVRTAPGVNPDDANPRTFDLVVWDNYNYLAAGETEQSVYSYDVSDGQATGTGSVTITITGVNDAPVAVADTNAGNIVIEAGEASAGQPTASGNVLTNDTDVDRGDTKTVTTPGTLNGTYGSLVLGADGSYTYTLDNAKPATQALAQGAQVNETFNYSMRDTAGATSSSTLTIGITARMTPPSLALRQSRLSQRTPPSRQAN